MKKLWMVLILMLAPGTALHGQEGDPTTAIDVVNQIGITQNQNSSTTSIAEGGSSWNDNKSNSNSQVNINSNSVSNYETRTPPLTTFPPYLPYWTHGGWGTIKAYFPNSPTPNDAIYETTFDPKNPEDIHELRSVLKALPHEGLAESVGGILNGIAVVLFDAPNKYHHGRGLEIINSVVRDRRPEGKPLLVFIDSNVDMNLLREEGYAYVGRVSIEGDVERNWDHAYKAAVTEALLWDTDVLLISGGMKGVTVGSNVTFPSAAGGYSQVNYSLSLFGAKATGITEGKGKAVLSADAYRFAPDKMERRRIPESLYDRIRARPRTVSQDFEGPAGTIPVAIAPSELDSRTECATPEIADPSSRRQAEPHDAVQDGRLLPRLEPPQADRGISTPPLAPPGPRSQEEPPVVAPTREEEQKPVAPVAREPAIQVQREAPQVRPSTARLSDRKPGIRVSRELLAMAGFAEGQEIKNLNVR